MNLYVFDLDKTLAPIGEPIPKGVKEKIILLQQKGLVAICSGKPVYYLVGLSRQLGIKNLALLGENGAVFQVGSDLPPSLYSRLDYPKESIRESDDIKAKIQSAIPDMYFQPNEIVLTPFPKNEKEFDIVQQIIDGSEKEHLSVFRHVDSFDILPLGIDKGVGVTHALKILGIPLTSLFTIGDTNNDVPMFRLGGTSIGVSEEIADEVDYLFPNIDKALDFLLA